MSEPEPYTNISTYIWWLGVRPRSSGLWSHLL